MSAQPLEIRLAHLEGAYEQISERLGGVDGRLTALDQKIDSRFDRLDEKIDQKIGALDQKMDSRFDAFEKKTDSRFDKVDARFDKQDARFDTFDKKLTTIMVTYLGTSAALTAAIIGVVVTHH